jgi:hypothetical protein
MLRVLLVAMMSMRVTVVWARVAMEYRGGTAFR